MSWVLLSADHLLAISENGIKSFSKSKTVAPLLPGTGYFLGKNNARHEPSWMQVQRLVLPRITILVAVINLTLKKIACLSAPNYKMNSTETWSSITLNASASLGLKNQGAAINDMVSRFSFWKCSSLDEVLYNWDENFSVWRSNILNI